MVECCGKKMTELEEFVFCLECGNRLLAYPYMPDIEKPLICLLVHNCIQNDNPTWKEFGHVMHELWKEGTTSGEYVSHELPKEWIFIEDSKI